MTLYMSVRLFVLVFGCSVFGIIGLLAEVFYSGIGWAVALIPSSWWVFTWTIFFKAEAEG